jgi:hypothetical protein
VLSCGTKCGHTRTVNWIQTKWQFTHHSSLFNKEMCCLLWHLGVLADAPSAKTQTEFWVRTRWCITPFPQWGYKVPCCAMAWVVSCWPVTLEPWVQSQASPHGFCGGQSGTGLALSVSTAFFPISTIALIFNTLSFICHWCYMMLAIGSTVK